LQLEFKNHAIYSRVSVIEISACPKLTFLRLQNVFPDYIGYFALVVNSLQGMGIYLICFVSRFAFSFVVAGVGLSSKTVCVVCHLRLNWRLFLDIVAH
jgi:hypothetical protein